MAKKSVYLDTTIPSHYFDQRPELQAFVIATKQWWNEERKRFQVFTSDYTLVELNRGNYPKKKDILDLISDIPVYSRNNEIDTIAEIYLKEYVMPKGAGGDAFHLACASFYKIDFLLTWNCNHLANANKEQHIQIVNSRIGLFSPRIVTPLQLFIEKE